jgi:hypothetical protein
MNKTIVVSLAILGLSASAALAAKTHHHGKKPVASTATAPANPMPFGAVSSTDKEMYLRNKRESGVK